ncbi:MAG TPA: hypothetical protein VGD80_42125, partial [Kofleriaceae bacterium]
MPPHVAMPPAVPAHPVAIPPRVAAPPAVPARPVASSPHVAMPPAVPVHPVVIPPPPPRAALVARGSEGFGRPADAPGSMTRGGSAHPPGPPSEPRWQPSSDGPDQPIAVAPARFAR